jgi:hypothetical protein
VYLYPYVRMYKTEFVFCVCVYKKEGVFVCSSPSVSVFECVIDMFLFCLFVVSAKC